MRDRPPARRVMNIAQGSLEELRYYFILAKDLRYVTEGKNEGLEEVARLLGAYTRSLRNPGSEL